MDNQATGQFKIESWEETPFSKEENGPDLIRAEVKQSYSGDIEGKSSLEYLITTYDRTFSRFIGIERIVGKVDGRTGSFVLNHEGTHENGVAKSKFSIDPDSGTGELEGIRGKGHFSASHEESEFTLEYSFE